jgi:hypothetical protein
LIFSDAIELPLTSDQTGLVANLLASQKRYRKSYLFLTLTDSFVLEAGRGIARLQAKVGSRTVAAKVLKQLTNNNQKDKV